MRKGLVLIAAGAVAALCCAGANAPSKSAPKPALKLASKPAPAFATDVTPLLQRYCFECHGDGASAGELELDKFAMLNDATAARQTWDKVIQYVRTQTMPPPDAELKLPQKDRDRLADAIERHVYGIDPARPDPGRVAIRRLNRVEYRNIIRDLTGVNFDPTLDFPQDDTGYGFDNIADVLTLPPMLMEKYLAAAEKVLNEAIPAQQVAPRERRFAATEVRASFNRAERSARSKDGWVTLSSREEDALSVSGEAPAPGEYRLRVLAYAKEAGGETVKLSIIIGDAVVRDLEISASEDEPQWYETRVGIPAGRHTVRIAMRRLRGPVQDRQVSHGRMGLEQAGGIAVKEISIDGPLDGAAKRIPGDRIELQGATTQRDGGSAVLHRDGDEASVTIDAPAAGQYILRAQAYATYAGDEPAKAELLLSGKPVCTFPITAPAAMRPSDATRGLSDRARRAVPRIYEMQTTLPAGRHRLALRFINNLRDDAEPDVNFRDRNIFIQHVEIVDLSAPPGSPPLAGPMRTLFASHPKPEDARDLLADFTLRAWRRPPRQRELDRLMKLYDLAKEHGEGHHAGIRHAMKAVLVSPHFLFHGELEPPIAQGEHFYPVSEFELASRLSFFLWSTMPDDELLDLATRGALRANLDAQVKRILASEKSQALVENFAGQWLQFRNLDAVHPDRRKFDEYDDRLRDAMQRETQLFFESIVREDRSLLEVLTADYTFVNERLARHYGIDGVKGDDFKRVSLADTPRRGLLTQGSVLTLTSNPTRTSPVKRGKWVLENLLGVTPPAPPPELPALEETQRKQRGATLRQQFEIHRADPTCASCHAPMDPIGFALENFDAIGAFREKDAGHPIDASAEFVDGTKFTGADEVAKILAKTRRNDFYRAAAQAALTFALGRGVEPIDRPAVDRIVDELHRTDGKFSSLVNGIVNSVPFQMRRAE